jgi:hypothetical protein
MDSTEPKSQDAKPRVKLGFGVLRCRPCLLVHKNANVPLILKVWNFMLRSGQFRRQKSLGPLKKPREMADYVFFPPKKHKTPRF